MKLYLNINDEMMERIEYYAKKMGTTKSAMCSMLIGQSIMSFDKTFEALNESMKRPLPSDPMIVKQISINEP